MSKMKKNKKPPRIKIYGKIVDEEDKFANDPVFLKRAEEAKAFIERVGLPKELQNRV